MIILPAIDLYKGEVVRLVKGDYAQMTVYSDAPVSVALEFKAAGAEAMHVVDLEGARDGAPANFDVIERLVKESGLDIQVGGGIRTAQIVEQYIKLGVKRVILGTVAVREPDFLRDMVQEFGEAIAVSVDIKDGFVAVSGWTETTGAEAFEFCRFVEDVGVRTLICTDISKDGLLSGSNVELYGMLKSRLSLDLIASGGVSSLDEIKTLAEIGMSGAILGKALYTGMIKLADAVKIKIVRDVK